MNPTLILQDSELNNEAKNEKVIALSSLENMCLCIICCTNYNESTKMARSLHCGHTFCTECIETVQEYGNSSFLECPTCRAETKCPIDQIAPNYFLMEIVRKLGFIAPSDGPNGKPAKIAQIVNQEKTIDEIFDEEYRSLITELKGDISQKFEMMRSKSQKATIGAAQNLLRKMSEVIQNSVYNSVEFECEDDESSSNDNNSSIEVPRENEEVPRGHRLRRRVRVVVNSVTNALLVGSNNFLQNVAAVENPLRSRSGSVRSISLESPDSDSSESSDEDGSDEDGSDDDECSTTSETSSSD